MKKKTNLNTEDINNLSWAQNVHVFDKVDKDCLP